MGGPPVDPMAGGGQPDAQDALAPGEQLGMITETLAALAQATTQQTQASARMGEALMRAADALTQAALAMAAPKRIVSDENGRPVGVEVMTDDGYGPPQ